MNREFIKVLGVVLVIYLGGYLLTGVMGGPANILIPIYGLNLIKKRNITAIKILLVLMLILNLGIIGYLLFGMPH